jgi:hypothetical protein
VVASAAGADPHAARNRADDHPADGQPARPIGPGDAGEICVLGRCLDLSGQGEGRAGAGRGQPKSTEHNLDVPPGDIGVCETPSKEVLSNLSAEEQAGFEDSRDEDEGAYLPTPPGIGGAAKRASAVERIFTSVDWKMPLPMGRMITAPVVPLPLK